MRRTCLLAALALLPLCAPVVAAQDRPSSQRDRLPADARRDVDSLFNASTVALRGSGPTEIEAGREVRGDVAVERGPLTVAGHVTGRVIALNADVVLRPSARIDGDLLVVGGSVAGRDSGYVGGEIRIYRDAIRVRHEGERVVAEDEPRDRSTDDYGWWNRWERHRSDENWTHFQVASAGAYNRVEGLPVNLGPQIYQRFPWGSARLDAYAVVRTTSSFSSSENDVGHNAHMELRLGRLDGVALSARAFSVVDPVESWQLRDLEVGLASFLAHRDYRDYYQRHGASGSVELFVRHGVSLTGTYGEERWNSRDDHDPFTLFRNDATWRPNPAVDEGRMHLVNGEFRVDTRNDDRNPWSGWDLRADWERGVGTLTSQRYPLITTVPVVNGILIYQPVAPSHVDYTRGFVDLRRYNRLSPDAQLNLRLVVGGWLNGDALPAERRLSVDGPGAMPGFGFRGDRATDVGTCGAADDGAWFSLGRPAECQRIALAQVEYRGDLHFDFGSDWDWNDDAMPTRAHRAHTRRFHSEGVWVLFADAGRGWLVGTPSAGTPPGVYYKRDEMPPLSTFRSDVGAGLDFGVIGFYAAKAVSTAGEPIRLFVRLRHRF